MFYNLFIIKNKEENRMKKQNKNTRKSTYGITLVALVITIIVLLILAGVSINLVAGSNGILGKATKAVEVSKLATQKEQLQLDLAAAQMDVISNGKLEIDQKTLTEIIEKYGKLQEDGDTIITENGNISLKEIYSNNSDILIPDENGNGALDNGEVRKLLAKMQTLETEVNKLKSVTKTIDDIYPVGSIYLSTNLATASDVSNKLGGTWESYALGRTLVGVGNSDQNFNAGETGGESNHTLSVTEMPSHSHDYSGKTGIGKAFGTLSPILADATGTGTIIQGGQWIFGYIVNASKLDYYKENSSNWPGANHYHEYSGTTTSFGENRSHNNLQPYITVYMYQRIN